MSSSSQGRKGDERIDRQYYDPDQNAKERRALKRRLRDIGKDLTDSRAEYLKADSDGLVRSLRDLNHVFPNVKQTSDAAIDSRILINISDLSHKKITDLTLGDSAAGVDVDDFVSQCITFMKRGQQETLQRGAPSPQLGAAGTQTQRRRARQRDEEDEDSGDPLDWDYLGRNACFLHNSRPCLSGFLLGPLSVQKKVRQQTQRRARERANPADATRPQVLREEDVEAEESANLTEICRSIATLLGQVQTQGQEAVEARYDRGEFESLSAEQRQALLRAHGIADNGLVPLFDFCVNPRSFGQTVENLFYVSFLVKEGSVGLDFDSRGLPTLGLSDDRSVAERQEAGVRNQAVFTLDFDVWETIVAEFAITRSIIPHRDEEEYDDGTREEGRGWYD